MSSMDIISLHYGVPAKRGGRVRIIGGTQREGVIVGSYGNYLRVRADGEQLDNLYHPTRLEYLAEQAKRP